MTDADSNLQIVQITDTHIRAEPGSRLHDLDVDKSLQAVLQHVQTHHGVPDLVLATGDLVHDDGAPAYERLRAFLEPLNTPVYCLPGNHDLPGVMKSVYAQGQVRYQRQVIAEPWQFILLDSSLPDSAAGHLADAELSYLDQTLAARPELYAMVCLHHHPVSVGSTWMDSMIVDNAAALFAVLDRHPQVRAVIWGHIHQAFNARYNHIELLAAPSTCIQFKGDSEQPAIDGQNHPGYRWFELAQNGTLRTGIARVVL